MTLNLARKLVVRVAGFDENDSETEDNGQDNEVVRRGRGDNHEPMVFSHSTINPILVEQVVPRAVIEVEEIGSRGSLNEQKVEDECDNTLLADPALVRVTTGDVGFNDVEFSRLDFHNQLQEIDREIARFDSSEGGSKGDEESLNTNLGELPTRSSAEDGLGKSMTEQQGILKEGKGKIKSGYTWSTIRNQNKGKGVLTSCSPKEGRRVNS